MSDEARAVRAIMSAAMAEAMLLEGVAQVSISARVGEPIRGFEVYDRVDARRAALLERALQQARTSGSTEATDEQGETP